MTEARDGTPKPSPRPTSKARRPRKFSLPDHHHEEASNAGISAFLDGPRGRRRRPRSERYHRRQILALDAPHEWSATLEHEAARQARYGRAMAILVVELADGGEASVPDAVAQRLAVVLGRELRETDRATRSAPDTFLVLLPETGEEDAVHLAGRIDRGFRAHGDEPGVTAEMRIEIAVPRRGVDPRDAIAAAERRLGDPLAAE